jgi:hypothetical protein
MAARAAELGDVGESSPANWEPPLGINDGVFIGAPEEKDPLVGPNDGSGTFTIKQRPIRRRLRSLPPFVVTRGGEYCFVPGLRALRWLAALQT